MARIGRMIQDANPQKSESYWTLDAAMFVLGSVLLWMVSNHLRFDDNRWQYNAWTYLIAVPTILVLISLCLRFVVGKFVERSLQVAFLLSVTVHLILLLAAVNVIIFSKWWPDIYEAISQQVPKEQTAKQYFTTANAKSVMGSRSSRPDYLRAVETEHEATEENLSAEGALQLAVQDRADLPTLQPDEQRQQNVQASLMERAEIVPTAPSAELRVAELSRAIPQATRPMRQKVDIPEAALTSNPAETTEVEATDVLSSVSRAEMNSEAAPVRAPQAFEVPEPTETIESVQPAPVTRAERPASLPQELAAITVAAESLALPKAAAAPSSSVLMPVPRVMIPDRVSRTVEEVTPAEPTAEQLEPRRSDNLRTSIETSSSQAPSSIGSLADRLDTKSISKPRDTSVPTERLQDLAARSDISVAAPQLRLNKATTMRSPKSATGPTSIASPSTGAGEMSQPLDSLSSEERISKSVESLVDLGEKAPDSSANGSSSGSGKGMVASLVPNPSVDGFTAANAASQPTSLPFERRGRDAMAELDRGELGGVSASPISEGKKLSGAALRRPGRGDKIEIPELAGRAESMGVDVAMVAEPSTSSAEASEGQAHEVDIAEVALDRVSELDRQEPNSMAADRVLDIDAADGVGGLLKNAEGGNRLTERRTLQPLTVPQELVTQRFIRDAAGAPRAVGSSIPIPRPAFQQRIDRMKEAEVSPSKGAAGPQTEEAIELGLAFLARTQRKDGRWRLQDYDTEVLIRSDTAATALSVLAFQGAGYTHRQFKYAPNVARAIAFLVANQKPDGDLYLPQDPASDQNGWLYSHSIAALALCEAYGMTQDAALREPAQRAVQFMVSSQDPQNGGWRYRPGRGTDTSVTGWFMMALQSAQLAGLEVPPSTRSGVQRWLTTSRGEGDEGFLYRYNPNAANTAAQRHGLVPNPTMTSVGVLMSLYNGGNKENSDILRAANYLLDHIPKEGNTEKSMRDTYYWYYSTQVMYHMGGEYWQKWYENLYPILIRTQAKEGGMAGSWEPLGDVPDLWGKYGGRLYVTTMNLLSLEVTYRHLPLYETSTSLR